MNLTEKKLGSKTVYKGKILALEVDDVELPGGKKSIRECVRHSGGAAVFLEKDGKILLVKQFRYLYGKPIYEIPAGKINAGEDPKIGAARELEEETGYKAELKSMLNIYPSPGYTDEIIYVFRAVNYEFVAQKLDDGEFLECEFISEDAVEDMIVNGEICDAKTVAAFYKYKAEKN